MSLDAISLPPGHRLVRVSDEPALWPSANEMCSAAWPEFMLHDPVADQCWPRLSTDWSRFQLVLVDEHEQIAAAVQAAPLFWDGTDDGLPEGWDDQFLRSVAGFEARDAPDALGAIQVSVAAARRGEGLSHRMLGAMRASAEEEGFGALIACVRPNGKARYPLLPIETYARWQRNDGLPVDPWLRVHARAGARLVRCSPRSMTISGSLAEWSEWTGLAFPASGAYVVDGALAPVEVDLPGDRGVYHDPNVWMVHDLRPGRSGGPGTSAP